MAIIPTPEWTVILHDLEDQPILDISRLISFNLTLKLNNVDNLSFSIDLFQFEQLCSSVGTTPRQVLYPAKTEIKVYRNGQALFGGIISSVDTEFSENGAKISVNADSYLQYFAYRLLKKDYTSTDRSEIAWDAIDTVQSEENGDLGITEGSLATTYDSDLTADYQDVKSIIMNYTVYLPVTYDFEITPEKVFNTYNRKGSDKPEIELVYPQNITKMIAPRNSDSLYNRIIGLGSGIGEERIESVADNATSQLTYRIRETKKLFNSVQRPDTLEDNTNGVLAESIGVLELPRVWVNGLDFDLNSVNVGDSIKVRVDGSTMCDDIDGMYRIYQLDIAVDENFGEQIQVSFYNPEKGGEIGV